MVMFGKARNNAILLIRGLTWSTGFKFDALRRAPPAAEPADLLATAADNAPARASILPVEAIVSVSTACLLAAGWFRPWDR